MDWDWKVKDRKVPLRLWLGACLFLWKNKTFMTYTTFFGGNNCGKTEFIINFATKWLNNRNNQNNTNQT